MVYRIRYCRRPAEPLEAVVEANNCAEALVKLRHTLADLHSPLVTSICAETQDELPQDDPVSALSG